MLVDLTRRIAYLLEKQLLCTNIATMENLEL